MIYKSFWNKKKVLITGNTGFKGSWLSVWLHLLGAEVFGYSLNLPSDPSFFQEAQLDRIITNKFGDIRNYNDLSGYVNYIQPDIVIHLAAQPIVRDSYRNPILTYETNVMGTVSLFEAIRHCSQVRVVLNVTTDKCYENKEWIWGYRENETLGGYDPYSNSKACSELVTSAYRDSFFNLQNFGIKHNVAIATARAGNVIGGGDWAKDRIIPDCIRALSQNQIIKIRNPMAIRPWQHVLEPLSGYLLLIQKLFTEPLYHTGAWNLGPDFKSFLTVGHIVENLIQEWGSGNYSVENDDRYHEAQILKLDISKAVSQLGWTPILSIEDTIKLLVDWYQSYYNGLDTFKKTIQQIDYFMSLHVSR